MTEMTKPTDQVRVFHGDSREVLRGLPDASIDSVVTDPPYALVSIGKRLGKADSAPIAQGRDGAFARQARGFMGKTWDTGETAFDPLFWAEVLRVLKPGGHVVAFGGSRTYGELQVAISAAGFDVRDSILEVVATDTAVAEFLNSLTDEQLRGFAKTFEDSRFGGLLAWVYGSGFPKSHDFAAVPGSKSNGPAGRVVRPEFVGTDFEEGWGTALKPAFEPIILAQKPVAEGSIAANVAAHRTGGLNIDGCRVPVTDAAYAANCSGDRGHAGTRGLSDTGATDMRPGGGSAAEGRFPANLIHDGSAEVVEAFPAEAGASAPVRGTEPSSVTNSVFGKFNGRTPGTFFGDTGTAARFFYSSKADGDDRVSRCPACSARWIGRRPCACPDKPVGHPTCKPVDVKAWLARLITPPGGVVLDCFAGSGTTGMACLREGFRAVLIEREAEYVGDIMHRLRHVAGDDAPLFGGRP